MELRDAIDQITTIRSQLAATEHLKSLRAIPVAFSGVLAIAAALVQTFWLEAPLDSPPPLPVVMVRRRGDQRRARQRRRGAAHAALPRRTQRCQRLAGGSPIRTEPGRRCHRDLVRRR